MLLGILRYPYPLSSRMTSGSARDVVPVGLHVEADDRLVIEWSDGVRHAVTWHVLRKNCPCAGCRMERQKPAPLLPVIKPEQAQPTRARSITPVGRYAYQMDWNDGHNSGIYTFELLRQLGEQAADAEAGNPPRR